jgi:hypothetical protein
VDWTSGLWFVRFFLVTTADRDRTSSPESASLSESLELVLSTAWEARDGLGAALDEDVEGLAVAAGAAREGGPRFRLNVTTGSEAADCVDASISAPRTPRVKKDDGGEAARLAAANPGSIRSKFVRLSEFRGSVAMEKNVECGQSFVREEASQQDPAEPEWKNWPFFFLGGLTRSRLREREQLRCSFPAAVAVGAPKIHHSGHLFLFFSFFFFSLSPSRGEVGEE